MKNSKLILLAAIAVSAMAGIGGASAADMAVKARPPIVAAPVLYWGGWYAGLNIGGTWDDNRNADHVAVAGPCNAAFPGCTVVPNYSTTAAIASTFGVPLGSRGSVIGGGQIGYNWQAANWLFGIETDIQGVASNNRSASFAAIVPNPNFPGFPQNYAATITRQLDYLGTVRGRVGFIANPAFLLYATGGLAYGGVRSSTTEAITVPLCAGAGSPCTGASFNSNSTTRAGWTVGGGGEWMFSPNWSVKGEYLYYDLGRVSYGTALNQFCTGAGCAVNGGLFASTTGTTTTRYNGHIVRVGVNYHFGGPVVARY